MARKLVCTCMNGKAETAEIGVVGAGGVLCS